MTVKITNLVKDDNKFTFNLVILYEPDDPEYDSNNHIKVKSFMTNPEGRGLFELDNYYHQYIGTCNFSCAGKSKGAARKYINRRIGITNYKGERLEFIDIFGLI